MPDAPGSERNTAARTESPDVPHEAAAELSVDLVAEIAARLDKPGLVVLTAAPGAGRTTVLRRLAEAFRGPVFVGGGLAILRTVPGLALARAVRARLPVHDQALSAEAVRSRVRGGLLLIDDLQWADALTLGALPAIATHCRVVAALRTPHQLPDRAQQRLQDVASLSVAVPPLDAESAMRLARRVAPGLGPGAVTDVVRRAGGIPLAVEALARHAAARPTGATRTADAEREVAYPVAEALADLTRPARTAMAALGLLGRPASRALLGPGVDELVAAGLVHIVGEAGGEQVSAISPYTAEVAAGLLDSDERPALHRRLADLVSDDEAARHLAASGDAQQAYERAVAAAAGVRTTGERADLLLFACGVPGAEPDRATRLAAAEAALVAGRPRSCLRVLGDDSDPHAAVLRGEALLHSGEAAAAERAIATVPDGSGDDLVAARDRVRLLASLATDPDHTSQLARHIAEIHGDRPAHIGLRTALAAVAAARRTPGWEAGLATAAAAAGGGGEMLAARWSAWLLVETLVADGRLAEAAEAARRAGDACAADLAYSWQTRFAACELWCTALRGENLDHVAGRAIDLVDRTLPAVARGYAIAAVVLAEADGGLLAPARGRLAGAGPTPPSVAGLLDWVAREAAWLDGQPDRATQPGVAMPDGATSTQPLVDGLRRITSRWAAYDGAGAAEGDAPVRALPPVAVTLSAWDQVSLQPERGEVFDPAAKAWHGLARREEVRCLLAYGLHTADAERAVPPLLAAERLAEESGLVVLLGRARRGLRRHAVRRETRGPRAGDALTDREQDVLRLVAQGEPTRRIAGLLGISRETVETHIRSGMRKLGARTRTEAAALAMEVLGE